MAGCGPQGRRAPTGSGNRRCREKIPTPGVGTHRRTNARRRHGNGKSSRSLKSSDFEPQIFLRKIFRAQPGSAGSFPISGFSSSQWSRSIPWKAALEWRLWESPESRGFGIPCPSFGLEQEQSVFFPTFWHQERAGCGRFRISPNFRDVKLQDGNEVIKGNIGKSHFPGSLEFRNLHGQTSSLSRISRSVSWITELFRLEKSFKNL